MEAEERPPLRAESEERDELDVEEEVDIDGEFNLRGEFHEDDLETSGALIADLPQIVVEEVNTYIT